MGRNDAHDRQVPRQLTLDNWADELQASGSRPAVAAAAAGGETARGAPSSPVLRAGWECEQTGRHAARPQMTQRDEPAETVRNERDGARQGRHDASAPSEDDRTLLTTNEAARLLRVHPRTVQRLVERGELCAVHLGAAVRFDPRDVTALIARVKDAAVTTASADAVRRPTRSKRAIATSSSFRNRVRSGT
jgi:excisionase family DNA binding protein